MTVDEVIKEAVSVVTGGVEVVGIGVATSSILFPILRISESAGMSCHMSMSSRTGSKQVTLWIQKSATSKQACIPGQGLHPSLKLNSTGKGNLEM